MRSSCGTSGFTVALLFVLSSVLAADYRTNFVSGIKAYNDKRYGEAIQDFEAAIREHPAESGEKIVINGGYSEAYTPHRLIVISLYRVGRCDEGERLRLEFAAQGALRDLRELDRFRSGCKGLPPLNPGGTTPARGSNDGKSARGGPPPPTTPPANAALDAATKRADDAIAAAKREKEKLDADPNATKARQTSRWGTDDRLGRAADAAGRALNDAGRSLDEARNQKDANKAEEAAASAERARTQYEAVITAVGTIPTELPAPPPPPPVPPTEGTSTGVNSSGGGGTAPGGETGPGSPPGTGGRGTGSGPATRLTPQSLLTAATLFTKADYAGVEKTLATATIDHEYLLQAEVLRAAALYSQYLAGGRADKATLAAAKRHVRRARQLDPTFQPSPRLFSPLFCDFYRVTR